MPRFTSIIVQDEGVDLPVRPRINFTGAGVTATDDAVNNRTNVTIPAWAPTDAPYLVDTAVDVPGLSAEVPIRAFPADLQFTDAGGYTFLFLDVSTDFLGIGTAAPTNMVHVQVTVNDWAVKIENLDATVGAAGKGLVVIAGNVGATNEFVQQWRTRTGATLMSFVSSGQLLIGVSAPIGTEKLLLHGAAADAYFRMATNSSPVGFYILKEVGPANINAVSIWNVDDTYMRFGTANLEAMRILESAQFLGVQVGFASAVASAQLHVGRADPTSAGAILAFIANYEDNTTGGVRKVAAFRHTMTGGSTAGNGIGTRVAWAMSDDAGQIEDAGYIDAVFTNAVSGAETSAMDFYTRSAGGAMTNQMRLDATGHWIAQQNGSVTAPIYAFAVSTGMGMYATAAHRLAFSTASVAAIEIQLGSEILIDRTDPGVAGSPSHSMRFQCNSVGPTLREMMVRSDGAAAAATWQLEIYDSSAMTNLVAMFSGDALFLNVGDGGTTGNHSRIQRPSGAAGAHLPAYSVMGDTNTGMGQGNAGGTNETWGVYCAGTERARWDDNATANETSMLIYDITAAALRRISIDANDSAGVGFRALRIPN